MTLLDWFRKYRAKSEPAKREPQYEPCRCGTPYLQAGGTLLVHTDNVVAIVRDTPAIHAEEQRGQK